MQLWPQFLLRGGLSAAALPIAAATGLSTTVIIAIIAVGGVALLKDYTIIIKKDEVILEKKNETSNRNILNKT